MVEFLFLSYILYKCKEYNFNQRYISMPAIYITDVIHISPFLDFLYKPCMDYMISVYQPHWRFTMLVFRATAVW